MPRLNLTQLTAERLRAHAGKAVIHWDTNLTGFGLRVSPKGRKTWVAQYRVRGGPEVLETIGTLSLIPKVAEARDKARISMVKAREGVDPRVARRAAAEQTKAAAVPTLTFGCPSSEFLRQRDS